MYAVQLETYRWIRAMEKMQLKRISVNVFDFPSPVQSWSPSPSWNARVYGRWVLIWRGKSHLVWLKYLPGSEQDFAVAWSCSLSETQDQGGLERAMQIYMLFQVDWWPAGLQIKTSHVVHCTMCSCHSPHLIWDLEVPFKLSTCTGKWQQLKGIQVTVQWFARTAYGSMSERATT